MANLDFRVLIETKKGRTYSYSSGSFINTDAHYVLQTDEVLERINTMPSGSFINAPGITFSSASEAAHSGSTPRTFLQGIANTNQAYLSCSIVDDATQGSIKFHNPGLINNDYLYRYKFYGNKVCNVLGLPENFWIYSDHFQLTSTASRANFLQGNVYAGGLNVRENLAIASSGEVSSDIPFKIKRDTDRWVKFTEGAGARDGVDVPVHQLLIGYSQNADRYEIRAGESPSDLYITGSNGGKLYNEIPAVFNKGITIPSETKLQFDSTDTFIQADGEAAENLEIHADDDIFLRSDGNVAVGGTSLHPAQKLTVEGKISASGDIICTGNFAALRGIGFGAKTSAALNPAYVCRNPLDYGDGFLQPPRDSIEMSGFGKVNLKVAEPSGRIDASIQGNTILRVTGSNVGIATLQPRPNERLEVDGNISSSGYHYQKAYPAFGARRSNEGSTTTSDTWTRLYFNAEDYDIGDDFDASGTSFFTAPTKGIYQFNCGINFRAMPAMTNMGLRLSGSNGGSGNDYGVHYDMNEMYQADSDSDGHTFTFSKAVKLETGVKIAVEYMMNNADSGVKFDNAQTVGNDVIEVTWFDGHLITPLK